MGMYDLVIVCALLIIGGILWVVLGHTLNIVADTFTGITPATIANQTVNQTAIQSEIQLTQNIYYFAFFIIAVIAFIWVLKKSSREQNIYGDQ